MPKGDATSKHRHAGRAALALIVVVLAGLGAACGHSHVASRTVSPSSRFAGWWDSDNWGVLHIVPQNGSYVLVPTLPWLPQTVLSLRNGVLSARPQGGGRLTLILTQDGAQLTGRFSEGGYTKKINYHRATTADIDNALQNANENQLARAIRQWRWNAGSYPAVTAVRPGGAFQRQLQPWPTNPYTGQPMAPGTQPGEYRYRFTTRGFTLFWKEVDASGSTHEDAPGWLDGVVTVSQGSGVRPAVKAKVKVRFNIGSKTKPSWLAPETAATDRQGHFEMTQYASSYTVTAVLKGVGRSRTEMGRIKPGQRSHVTLVISAR